MSASEHVFAAEEARRQVLKALEFGEVQLSLIGLALERLPAELGKLKSLQSLNLSICRQLQNLEPLAGLSALQSLDLSFCGQLQNLEPLAGLKGLKSFSFLGASLFDCSPSAQPLASWRLLEELYANRLIGAPSELGSRDSYSDNALPRIRAWQKDLAAGEAPNSTVKVFVLGNGRVGKTQLCRRLRGESFDPSIESTHGISLHQVPLSPARGDQPAVDANFWDFGGQDIYLGTHALFLDARAIYVIAWAVQYENTEESEESGMPLRNRPLTYWLEYVRSLAGTQAPVIVVQTQCDRELDVHPPSVPADHGFERWRVTSSSAKQEDGVEGLRLELKSAARYQLERYGKVRLPANWVAVAGEMRARIGQRTMPRAEFDQICTAGHGSAVPGVVLEYLHRSGQVFFREGLFGNQVILDLGWALAGVYAVLDRKTALPEIRRQAGRFSPQLLAALAWREYGEEEHKLFLSLMEQCQICFKISDDVFIAPALLPAKAAVQNAMEQVWRGATPEAVAHLDYAFLHEGVLRAMLCGIGEKAGVHGVYWAYGVCFYDAEHKSTVRIYSELPHSPGLDPTGRITVEAAGPGALPLAEHLVQSIQQLNIGRSPEVTWALTQGASRTPAEPATSSQKEAPFAEVRPAPPPRLAGEPKPVYVSYAWGGESDALVDEVERKLPAGIKLIRDKGILRPGDWIASFMMEIGRADCVLVVFSHKYVRSPYCMRELLYLYNTSLGERDAFLRKLVPLTLGDVRFSRALDRVEHVKYWKQEHGNLDAALAPLDHASVGENDRAELLLMKDFQHRVSDMLAWVAGTLMPQGEELHTKGIDAAIDLIQQRAFAHAASTS